MRSRRVVHGRDRDHLGQAVRRVNRTCLVPFPIRWQLPLGQWWPQLPAANRQATPAAITSQIFAMHRVIKVVNFVIGEADWVRHTDKTIAVVGDVGRAVAQPLIEHRLEHLQRAAGVWYAEEGVVVEAGIGAATFTSAAHIDP